MLMKTMRIWFCFSYYLLLLSCLSFGSVFGSEKFTFPNFQNRPRLNLNGDAETDVGDLVLTKPLKNQVGAVWFDTPVDISKGFITTFTFTFTQIENEGAEGLAFVLQNDGPYAMGNGGSGLGYDGLTGFVAVELDLVETESMKDPKNSHISIHRSNSQNKLEAIEPVVSTLRKEVDDLKDYDENPDNEFRSRTLRVEYLPNEGNEGLIEISISHIDEHKHFVQKKLISASQIGSLNSNKFYVGFTASTGSDSFCRIALKSWGFSSNSNSGCSDGFDGGKYCEITNEIASRECPKRSACNVCVEDVYNCAWCETTSGENKCVVGTTENIRTCKTLALEPLACTNSLSKVYLYMFVLSLFIVVIFGIVLYKTLPVIQSFKAISLLVALVGGALSGMGISFIISVSLVEISETPVFAVGYGLFFLFEAVLIGAHIWKNEIPNRGLYNSHVLLLCFCAFSVILSSLACFILDKRFIHWLPETPKIIFYTILGATLNFCFVFSIAELIGEAVELCNPESSANSNIQSSSERRNQNKASNSIMSSQARVALLAASSIISGMFFGFMFGTLRIEEESQYRVALALQQEAAYTYPVGALIGGVSTMLYQLIQLPLASDEQIDRIIRNNNDGL